MSWHGKEWWIYKKWNQRFLEKTKKTGELTNVLDNLWGSDPSATCIDLSVDPDLFVEPCDSDSSECLMER